MNDESLKSLLHKLDIPLPDDAARERALHRATVVLANHPRKAGSMENSRSTGLPRWAFALCAVVIVAAFAVFVSSRPRGGSSPTSAQVMLEQLTLLFPGQIEAVIERDGMVEVEIAAQRSLQSDQPLMLTLVRGNSVVRVLSYSGRRICLDLGGRRECFEALLTDDGRVILAGDKFLWSTRQPATLAGYRVEAVALAPAS